MMDCRYQKTREREWARSKEQASQFRFSDLLVTLYSIRTFRPAIIHMVKRLEGGEFFSQTLRRIFRQFHGITVGRYSYGCFNTYFPPGTGVGAYVSVAEDVHILRRNHPFGRLTQHPFFYNHRLGLVEQDTIALDIDNPLTIGNDVWIGRGSLILPGCRRIGNGAIIGAHSVITRDVPPFAIMAGNPARKIRDRFDPAVAATIGRMRWWELSIEDLIERDMPFLSECDVELADAFNSTLSSVE